MVYITHIRTASGNSNEHITHVRWLQPDNNQVGESSIPTMVDWIDHKGGIAKVKEGNRIVDVGVVHADPPYLRTHADGTWTNNLLALPRF